MPRFDKLLILDLDETLVHTTCEHLGRAPDFEVLSFPVYKRPGLDRFLTTCVAWFELAVWTSAVDVYASPMVANIFPDPTSLTFVWTRERCTARPDPSTGQICFLKDLNKVESQGYRIEKVLIVDDTPATARLNPDNVIPISKYTGSSTDEEFDALLVLLEMLGSKDDVRTVAKRGRRLESLELSVG